MRALNLKEKDHLWNLEVDGRIITITYWALSKLIYRQCSRFVPRIALFQKPAILTEEILQLLCPLEEMTVFRLGHDGGFYKHFSILHLEIDLTSTSYILKYWQHHEIDYKERKCNLWTYTVWKKLSLWFGLDSVIQDRVDPVLCSDCFPQKARSFSKDGATLKQFIFWKQFPPVLMLGNLRINSKTLIWHFVVS
jgi:hypothetical protein